MAENAIFIYWCAFNKQLPYHRLHGDCETILSDMNKATQIPTPNENEIFAVDNYYNPYSLVCLFRKCVYKSELLLQVSFGDAHKFLVMWL